MYDHKLQYRCPIIRGKAKTELDDLLPAYAEIIMDICPCQKTDFIDKFNDRIRRVLSDNPTIKTINNHRTEIAGKLFGMYYHERQDERAVIFASDRTRKFVYDHDQPAFFKDICYKMQFPNGMIKPHLLMERVGSGISIRPNSFVIKMLVEAEDAGLELSKKDIGYYILNSLDVLCRRATPKEVIDQISSDKRNGIARTIERDGHASSFASQHTNEQINYLELANLVVVTERGIVQLNPRESHVIDLFAREWDSQPLFDMSSVSLETSEERDDFVYQWTKYYGELSEISGEFSTTLASLGITQDISDEQLSSESTTVTGDEGELYVFRYEKDRVGKFNPRLAGKVVHLGKIKGLGYDIQSVVACQGDRAEFVRYIEVKSTKRVTEPDTSDSSWTDSIILTRNEWIAATQHGNLYFIYRVYFVREKVIFFVINDLIGKCSNEKVQSTPIMYRVDFTAAGIDEVICPELEQCD